MLKPKVEEIKRHRLEMGLNRQELSIKAGLPKNAFFRIERGESRYTYSIRAQAMAKALHCKLADIFDDVPGK